jgi:hypothetical protein
VCVCRVWKMICARLTGEFVLRPRRKASSSTMSAVSVAAAAAPAAPSTSSLSSESLASLSCSATLTLLQRLLLASERPDISREEWQAQLRAEMRTAADPARVMPMASATGSSPKPAQMAEVHVDDSQPHSHSDVAASQAVQAELKERSPASDVPLMGCNV